MDAFLPVVAALTSLLIGAASNILALPLEDLAGKWPWLRKLLGSINKPQSYGDRIKDLTSSLTKTTTDLDTILSEMEQVTLRREQAVKALEDHVLKLEGREKELTTRIESLKHIPLPVAEHFAALTDQGEKRSARRDYTLFAAGVLVSTVTAIVLKMLGIG